MPAPLAERHCEVCRPGMPTLSRPEAQALLAELAGWTVEEADGHLQLRKRVTFKGFLPGVELINLIAPIAEAEGHHPDLTLRYGSLDVTLWTHVAGGLTANDFILAAKVDRAVPSTF